MGVCVSLHGVEATTASASRRRPASRRRHDARHVTKPRRRRRWAWRGSHEDAIETDAASAPCGSSASPRPNPSRPSGAPPAGCGECACVRENRSRMSCACLPTFLEYDANHESSPLKWAQFRQMSFKSTLRSSGKYASRNSRGEAPSTNLLRIVVKSSGNATHDR